ncbi:MAG: universal stress protein [Thermodesulfobacteria bacterium]|nr:universal stress protein [Thermodesulfobacteriota bacterium]
MREIKYEKVMIATDGSPASQGAIEEGIRFAKTFGCKVYGICVGELPLWGLQVIEAMQQRAKEIVEEVKTKAEAEGLECEVIPEVGDDIADCIVREVEKNKIDLVVVGKKAKRPFLGGIAIKVLGAAPCDVIVVPEGAKVGFEKFLVCVDGSVYSEVAAEKAFFIAKKTGASVKVIAIAESEDEKGYAEEALEITNYLAQKYQIQPETKVEIAKDIAKKIVQEAEEQKVSMIFMGSHGKSSEEYIIGDIIRKVFEITHIPIFVSKHA